MGRDEQNEEREVLSAIFPDEITDLSEHSFRISIALDDYAQDGDSPPPTLLLTITFPESYPDVAPDLDLSAPPNAPKHPYLEISSDRDTLVSALEEPIQDNLGMQMIFTLVSTLKDGAELLITERRSAQEKLKEVEAQKVEEAENAKFQGERVTRESFVKWREEFRREMEEKDNKLREEREAEDKKKRVKVEEKISGRMLWEKGLVGKVEEEEGDEEGLEKGVGEMKVEG
ncbi:MAG: hypothetical protein MMC23_003976 [Stictis urceolatum]|nr:hypothetical protein [Stictis urceolata]